jgi:hypothetical protein
MMPCLMQLVVLDNVSTTSQQPGCPAAPAATTASPAAAAVGVGVGVGVWLGSVSGYRGVGKVLWQSQNSMLMQQKLKLMQLKLMQLLL